VLGRNLPHALIKTIKFKANPTPEELIKQLKMINQGLKTIVESGKDLAVKLCKSEPATAQKGMDNASKASSEMMNAAQQQRRRSQVGR
jgi:hypothetical protein